MDRKIFIVFFTIILFSLSSFVYSKEQSLFFQDDLFSYLDTFSKINPEDRAMTGYYPDEDVFYPPEYELQKQGLDLVSYKQSLKSTAPKNRNSSVDNIWGTVPLSGTIKIPVLLLQFSDRSGSYTQAEMNNFFNSQVVTMEQISVSKYYNKQSYDELNIIFDVYNWKTLPSTYSYYSLNNTNNFQMELDAISLFNSTIDYTQYDNDNDGRIDGFVMVFAGSGGSAPSGVWPHARILRNWNNNTADGKYYGNLAVIPEKGISNFGFFEISVATHEFAHVLGLPDLYALGSSGQLNSGPINNMTMMSSSYDSIICNTPINLDVWSRYFLGWINPTILTTDSPKEITLRSVNDYPDAVILKNNNLNSREFYIVENRYRNLNDPNNLDRSMFYGANPNYGGIAIYHVDEAKIEYDYPNNWVNWDRDGNYYTDNTWPGIILSERRVTSSSQPNYVEISKIDMYFNGIMVDCDYAYFDEISRPCYHLSDILGRTTYSYNGNQNTKISFQALTPANQPVMQARMLVGDITSSPSFSPVGGTYAEPILVTLESAGSVIYYTLDGSTPTTSSQVYSSPILIESTKTIKAVAKKNNQYLSEVSTSTYTITGTVSTPYSNYDSGIVDYLTQIILLSDTPGAVIRYTLDGSEPLQTSPYYSSPIIIIENTTLKTKAFKTGWNPSETVTYNYEVLVCDSPISSLASGNYPYSTTLELFTSTSDSEIYYTLDGGIPSTSSLLYSSPIELTTNSTLTAKTYKPNFAPSQVATYNYTVNPKPNNFILSFNFLETTIFSSINNDTNTIDISVTYDIDVSSLTPIINLESDCSIFPGSGVTQDFTFPVFYTVSSLVGERTYVVTVTKQPRVFPPIASISGGNFSEPLVVYLTSPTPNAVIHYTLDGSFPNSNSPVYSSPIPIDSTTTLMAISFLYIGPGLFSSPTTSTTFSTSTTSSNFRDSPTSKGVPDNKQTLNISQSTCQWATSSLLSETYILDLRTRNTKPNFTQNPKPVNTKSLPPKS